MTIEQIATQLSQDNTPIQLLYAFNSVGKTRLSVAYQNVTTDDDNQYTGIYYNAYSEDIFVWHNDHVASQFQLRVLPSTLSNLHGNLTEERIHSQLKPYRVSFDFVFKMHSNVEEGIHSISFFPKDVQPDDTPSIKISRGEERIFIWCFFLAMMEIEGWADKQSKYIFIDDPVTSLDDHNIFVTAQTLYDLIEAHSDQRTVIIATHHVGLFSILSDWLKKGKKSDKFKNITKVRILSRKHDRISLETHDSDVFLYHLRLIQILEQARKNDSIRVYHFALLRQVLETISSFLGSGRFIYTLKCMGFAETDQIARIVNSLSHKKVYTYDSDYLVPDNLELFDQIMDKLFTHYNFIIHDSKT